MSAAKPLNLSVRGKALLFAVLTGLGWAGNYFSVPVIYDTDFVFGSIFSMLALQLLGERLGVASALVAASATLALWGHPYAMVLFTAEAAAVALLAARMRVDFVKADAIYWCVLGMPLALLFYHYALRLPLPATANFMLMQALNGIGNALIARLVFFGVAGRLQLERSSLRELIFNVLLLLALLLSLVTTSVNSRRERDMLDQGIRESLDLGGARTVANLEGWLQGHVRRIGHLAEMAAKQPLPLVRKTLELNIAGLEMKRVAVLDRNASVIAHSEAADKLGQPHIGRSFADRPYIPQLKQTLAPMLSEVVMSGLGFSEPIVGVLAPVVSKGAYAGYVIGVLDLSPVEKLIALNTQAAIWESLNYALVDRNGKVILSNNAKLKIMQPFAREPGELIALPGGLAQWRPAPKEGATAAERWTESAYVFEATVDKTSGWRLVLEVPSHQFAEDMYTGYAQRRSFAAVILLATFLLAGLLSRKISASLEDLKRVSADLPRRLSGGEEIDWGHSSIADVQDLKDNFSGMAQELTRQFGEIRAFNASLESKVARRTAELNTHKAELEAQNEDLRRTQVDLEAAQARYFELYQLAPVGYVSISKPGLILQANLNAGTRLGVARGALLGQPISRFILREDQDVFYKNRKQLFETGEAQAFELRMVKHDGTLFWAHLAASAVQDADGAPELRVVLTDITERKAAEDEVRRSEARHISMVSNISDVIAIIGADGIVKYRSPNVEKWFGWQPQDLPGANGWLTVHPDDLKRIQEKFFALLEKDNSVAVMEYRFKCKDGSYRPIELHATNRVNDPAIGGVLLNYHDITARRQAEAEVRKLSHALEQSPASVVITDRAGSIEYVNSQFEKQTGYALAEVLGRNPRILKSGWTSADTYREMWGAISAGGEWRGDLCNRRKNGELYWEDAAISGLKDENGQVTHFIGVKADITASKQAAEALQEMRRREVGIGASLQRSLLGEVPAGIEGAQLAAYADPSQIIDGDFYTVRRYRPDCFEVLAGDVMGKGVPAALMGAGIIAAYNRALADLLVGAAGARSLPTPAEIVNAIHRELTPQMIALSSFATLALYRFDLEAGTLTWVNAGHTPGLLTRGLDARAVAVMGENLPLGVVPEEVYAQSSLAVGPGDSLLVFSDGITEARNAAGEEFGLERLLGLIEPGSMADLPPATMLHALRGEQRRFTGGGPGADDLTALMVKLHPRRRAPRGVVEDRVQPFVFTLPWSLEGLGALRARVAECAGSLPAEDADALVLASFEAATNALRYSRLLVGDATLICRIAREDDALAVELIYPSAVFTPPAEVQPDLSGESEGGFGLFIIEQSVDSVEYASPMPGIASVRLLKHASAAAA